MTRRAATNDPHSAEQARDNARRALARRQASAEASTTQTTTASPRENTGARTPRGTQAAVVVPESVKPTEVTPREFIPDYLRYSNQQYREDLAKLVAQDQKSEAEFVDEFKFKSVGISVEGSSAALRNIFYDAATKNGTLYRLTPKKVDRNALFSSLREAIATAKTPEELQQALNKSPLGPLFSEFTEQNADAAQNLPFSFYQHALLSETDLVRKQMGMMQTNSNIIENYNPAVTTDTRPLRFDVDFQRKSEGLRLGTEAAVSESIEYPARMCYAQVQSLRTSGSLNAALQSPAPRAFKSEVPGVEIKDTLSYAQLLVLERIDAAIAKGGGGMADVMMGTGGGKSYLSRIIQEHYSGKADSPIQSVVTVDHNSSKKDRDAAFQDNLQGRMIMLDEAFFYGAELLGKSATEGKTVAQLRAEFIRDLRQQGATVVVFGASKSQVNADLEVERSRVKVERVQEKIEVVNKEIRDVRNQQKGQERASNLILNPNLEGKGGKLPDEKDMSFEQRYSKRNIEDAERRLIPIDPASAKYWGGEEGKARKDDLKRDVEAIFSIPKVREKYGNQYEKIMSDVDGGKASKAVSTMLGIVGDADVRDNVRSGIDATRQKISELEAQQKQNNSELKDAQTRLAAKQAQSQDLRTRREGSTLARFDNATFSQSESHDFAGIGGRIGSITAGERVQYIMPSLNIDEIDREKLSQIQQQTGVGVIIVPGRDKDGAMGYCTYQNETLSEVVSPGEIDKHLQKIKANETSILGIHGGGTEIGGDHGLASLGVTRQFVDLSSVQGVTTNHLMQYFGRQRSAASDGSTMTIIAPQGSERADMRAAIVSNTANDDRDRAIGYLREKISDDTRVISESQSEPEKERATASLAMYKEFLSKLVSEEMLKERGQVQAVAESQVVEAAPVVDSAAQAQEEAARAAAAAAEAAARAQQEAERIERETSAREREQADRFAAEQREIQEAAARVAQEQERRDTEAAATTTPPAKVEVAPTEVGAAHAGEAALENAENRLSVDEKRDSPLQDVAEAVVPAVDDAVLSAAVVEDRGVVEDAQADGAVDDEATTTPPALDVEVDVDEGVVDGAQIDDAVEVPPAAPEAVPPAQEQSAVAKPKMHDSDEEVARKRQERAAKGNTEPDYTAAADLFNDEQQLPPTPPLAPSQPEPQPISSAQPSAPDLSAPAAPAPADDQIPGVASRALTSDNLRNVEQRTEVDPKAAKAAFDRIVGIISDGALSEEEKGKQIEVAQKDVKDTALQVFANCSKAILGAPDGNGVDKPEREKALGILHGNFQFLEKDDPRTVDETLQSVVVGMAGFDKSDVKNPIKEAVDGVARQTLSELVPKENEKENEKEEKKHNSSAARKGGDESEGQVKKSLIVLAKGAAALTIALAVPGIGWALAIGMLIATRNIGADKVPEKEEGLSEESKRFANAWKKYLPETPTREITDAERAAAPFTETGKQAASLASDAMDGVSTQAAVAQTAVDAVQRATSAATQAATDAVTPSAPAPDSTQAQAPQTSTPAPDAASIVVPDASAQAPALDSAQATSLAPEAAASVSVQADMPTISAPAVSIPTADNVLSNDAPVASVGAVSAPALDSTQAEPHEDHSASEGSTLGGAERGMGEVPSVESVVADGINQAEVSSVVLDAAEILRKNGADGKSNAAATAAAASSEHKAEVDGRVAGA